MQLNIEQRKLANSNTLGHSLIKGIAGSGKTTVGVCRISHLLANHTDINDKILFLTYNKSLSRYIKYHYEKVEAENKFTNIFFEEKSIEKNKVKVTTVDSLMFHYFREYCKFNKKTLSISWSIDKKFLYEALKNIKKRSTNELFLRSYNDSFLRDEISWIKGCNYSTLEMYQTADRIGRSVGNSDGPARLSKNSKTREDIFNLMLEIDQLTEKINQIDNFKATSLALGFVLKNGVCDKYKHIIIDEAQDLTKLQLDFINALKKDHTDSSILFLTDIAQSIYPQAWLVKGRTFASIGYDMTGKSAKLSKNYRTTTEIAEAAYSLLEKDELTIKDENFVKPSLLEKSGEYPTYRYFNDFTAQYTYVAQLINRLRKTTSLKDITIVSRLNKNLQQIQNFLVKFSIETSLFNNNNEINFDEEKIKLLTLHSVKGLEFKIVILLDINSDQIPFPQKDLSDEERLASESMDRRLLYVGMTRAIEKLFICSHGDASKFIKDINPNFLLMQSGSKCKSFYALPYSEYRFTGQVDRLHSDEESVRQWIINELIVSYRYPNELINIEYNVKNFSKDGRVDAVVMNDRTKEPYIFIETKKKNIDINEAIVQLKSYMNVSKTLFGIATNGDSIVFLDSNFNHIKDIPIFSPQLLNTTLESYQYIDSSSNQEYLFQRDSSCPQEIIYQNNTITKESLKTIPVYSNIAAGAPIEITDEIMGEFDLPINWMKNGTNAYILTVKGNSMIDAGIDNGDMVVIHQCNTANDREIVAVDYNGSTTLKRIMRMGNSVLLISENRDYEPINITEGELRIMGKLIGVIKRKCS